MDKSIRESIEADKQLITGTEEQSIKIEGAGDESVRSQFYQAEFSNQMSMGTIPPAKMSTETE